MFSLPFARVSTAFPLHFHRLSLAFPLPLFTEAAPLLLVVSWCEQFTPAQLAAAQIDEVVRVLVDQDPRYQVCEALPFCLCFHCLSLSFFTAFP